MRLQTTYRAAIAALILPLVVVCSAVAATQRTLVAPTITDFTPKTGAAGTKVVITGTGLTGASVTFRVGSQGGPKGAAEVVVNTTGTSVTATVPTPDEEGVPPAGPITVTTADGTVSTSVNFTYSPSASTTTTTTATTTTTPAAAAPAHPAAVVKYYTYKAKVKLGAGKTLHFRTGKGYYAA
jgi:hypothetical protein